MKRLISAAVISALLGCRPAASPVATPPSTDQARAFVVAFYGWYWKPDSTKNVDSVMARHHDWLTADLAALVDSDNACAARARGECQLEEDPFLASQDPCERYEVGGAMAHHDTVGVSVFGVCGGKRDTVPAVIAMVIPHDSTWQFANFVYPSEKADLRAILTQKAP